MNPRKLCNFGSRSSKRLGTTFGALELQAWFAVTGLPILWSLSRWLEHGQWAAVEHATPLQWAALLYTVFVSSLIAHSGYYWLVSRYPVTSVTPLTTLSPVFSIVLGVWLLGDRVTARLLIGGALTLIGVTIIALRERRPIDTGT